MSSKYFGPGEIFDISGSEDLTIYQCSDRVMDHLFCKICGIHPFARYQDTYRVNLGCVEGVDVLALDVRLIDGQAFWALHVTSRTTRSIREVLPLSGPLDNFRATAIIALAWRRWRSTS